MTAGKHILVVSQYFYPEQFRINDICKEWIKRGFRVTVITGIPNYPQGEFYEGYDKRHRRGEKWSGIEIIRIPITPRRTGSINMIKNYLSFVWSGFWWNQKNRIKADYVFIFEVSPMTQALVGVWYAKKWKIPCYLYVQDLWPENVEIVTGIHSPIIISPINKMVNYIYKHCDHIFATSPSFVDEIQKRCKEKDKVSYWPQYAEEFYCPTDRNMALKEFPEIPDDGSFKLVFTGNIGKAQGLDILPEAAIKLKRDGVNVKIVIVGDGRNKNEFLQQIKDKDVEDRFIIMDRQKPERIPAILACCDAAFVSFMDNELFAKTIPAKLQSYMACGMPIIAVAKGETERVISEAKCGLCCQIGDEVSLAGMIIEMSGYDMENMKQKKIAARAYFLNHFEKNKLLNQIQKYFAS